MTAVMSVTTPDWLSRHDGDLRPSKDGLSWLVFFAGQMQYALIVAPVAGKFGSRVTQTINGKRLDSGASYPTVEDAVRGGLEDLRKALGW
jgi:hypothetical protein